MAHILYLFIATAMLLVFYQDVKYRAVSWILFPVIGILLFIQGAFKQNLVSYLLNVFTGSILILILITSLFVVMRIRKKVSDKFFDEAIGWGDVLMFLIFCFAFSPFNLILFLTFSLVISLIVFVPVQMYIYEEKVKIPLAGIQGLLYTLLIIPFTYILEIDVGNDKMLEIFITDLIYNYIYGLH